jgi:hypothetical protein
MTDRNAIGKVDGIGGMTGNERLFVSGLMDGFDKALKNDKNKARLIFFRESDFELSKSCSK